MPSFFSLKNTSFCADILYLWDYFIATEIYGCDHHVENIQSRISNMKLSGGERRQKRTNDSPAIIRSKKYIQYIPHSVLEYWNRRPVQARLIFGSWIPSHCMNR